MPDLTTLQDLKARVDAATGEDYELDLAIATWLHARAVIVEYDPWLWLERNGGWTGSIDAAVALTERVLPGQHWTLGQNVHHHYWLCTFNILDTEGAPYSNGSSHAAPTPPLAILSALLSALIAQEQG